MIKHFFIKDVNGLKKRIDFTKSLYVDRIITKDNAVKNLWEVHNNCRSKTLQDYSAKIIKSIDMGVI